MKNQRVRHLGANLRENKRGITMCVVQFSTAMSSTTGEKGGIRNVTPDSGTRNCSMVNGGGEIWLGCCWGDLAYRGPLASGRLRLP